jgi:hypothetical protein
MAIIVMGLFMRKIQVLFLSMKSGFFNIERFFSWDLYDQPGHKMKTIIPLIAILFSVQVVYAEQLIIRSKDADGKEEVIIHEYTPVPERPREKARTESSHKKKTEKEKDEKSLTEGQTDVSYPSKRSRRRKKGRPVQPIYPPVVPVYPPVAPIPPPVAVPLPSSQ